MAAERGDAWARAELGHWLCRAGRAGRRRTGDPEGYALAMAGDWRGAADAWEELGFPYEAAEALSDADDDDARLEALARFEALGALRSAATCDGGCAPAG